MDARGTPTPAVAGRRSVWKLIGTERGKGTLLVMVGAGMFAPKTLCTVLYDEAGRPIRSHETGERGRGSSEK